VDNKNFSELDIIYLNVKKIIFLFKLIEYYLFKTNLLLNLNKLNKYNWGMGIGDWAQSPIPNPQSPIPNPHFS